MYFVKWLLLYFVLFSSRVSVSVKCLCTWIYATFCCHYHSHTLTADKIKALIMTCCGVMLRVHWRTRMELKRSSWMRSYVCKSDSSMFWRLRTWLRLPIGGSNLGEWRLHHWSSMPARHASKISIVIPIFQLLRAPFRTYISDTSSEYVFWPDHWPRVWRDRLLNTENSADIHDAEKAQHLTPTPFPGFKE